MYRVGIDEDRVGQVFSDGKGKRGKEFVHVCFSFFFLMTDLQTMMYS